MVSSTPVPEVPLASLDKPVAATNTRYCSAKIVTLTVDDRFLWSDTNYLDAHTLSNRFIVKNQALSSRQTLVDGSNSVPIVNYKKKTFSSKSIKYVRAGTESDSPELFQIYAKYRRGTNTDVRVEFRDAVSGVPYVLEFEGNWRRRQGYFWLSRGVQRVREVVAKVHCPNGCSRSKHNVIISPNMDAALIVMVCEILRVNQSLKMVVVVPAVAGAVTAALIL